MIKFKNGLGIKMISIGKLEFLWVDSIKPRYYIDSKHKAIVFGKSHLRWVSVNQKLDTD